MGSTQRPDRRQANVRVILVGPSPSQLTGAPSARFIGPGGGHRCAAGEGMSAATSTSMAVAPSRPTCDASGSVFGFVTHEVAVVRRDETQLRTRLQAGNSSAAESLIPASPASGNPGVGISVRSLAGYRYRLSAR